MTTLKNLPEEVMIDILSRLPSETLLQFKFVSKLWYALINDPKIVRKHFSKYILLTRHLQKRSGKTKPILSILELPLTLDQTMSILDLDLPFDEDSQNLYIAGHSHGLVCLTDYGRNIFLCNPTIREFHKLPPSILHHNEPPTSYEDNDSCTNAIGFGYDSKSKDFKVVTVVDFEEGGEMLYPPRVEVYDLSKDIWREIEAPVCAHAIWESSFNMYHKGMYYWYGSKGVPEGPEGETQIIETYIIQSFDMSEEVFGEILVPESVNDLYNGKTTCMGVFNGSIVLFDFPVTVNEKTFDIWEMEKDESGVVFWSKLFTIGPISGIETPLLFVSSDELLMEASEGRVISYNITTQQFKELPLKGKPMEFQAIFCVKSLLSVNGGNNISYEF